MRILKRNTTGTGSAATGFVEALRQVLKKDPGATVKISRMKPSGMRARYLGEVSGRDLLEVDVSTEELLKEAHGGGDYSLTFSTSKGVPPQGFDSTYKFYIDGKPKGTYRESSSERRGPQEDTAMKALTDIMSKLADSAISKGNDDMLREVLVVALNAAFSKADPLDQAEKLIGISQTLQPHIEPQDPMTALLGAFAPALTQLLAMRAGEMSQATQQAARPPGATYQSIGQSESSAKAPMSVEDEGREISDRHDAFQKLILLPFRQHVTDGAPAEQLASAILYMIQFCEYWMAEDPPILVRDFLGETDPVKLLQAYDTFCSSIPELKNQKELIERIKDILIKTIIQIYQTPSEEPGEDSKHEYAGTGESELIARTGIEETH